MTCLAPLPAFSLPPAPAAMVWWSWEQWQEEIDRMALWGINLPLAFVGSEWAWR